MNQTEQNPTLFQKIADNHVDYSEMYRTQERKQLNKRLRKTRNILLICAAALVAGAGIFWIMPETLFTTKNLLIYFGLAAVMVLLAIYSNKQPYFSILAALIICIGFWAVEIFFNDIDDLLIETSIQKLFIISLLVSSFHSSKEAELIRKELHFSSTFSFYIFIPSSLRQDGFLLSLNFMATAWSIYSLLIYKP